MMIGCRTVLLLAALLPAEGTLTAGLAPPIFDAHIHYNEDVWEALPPQRILELLDEAGIPRSLVSSTPAEGAGWLYAAAPAGRVVPFLRPYPGRAHRYTWFREPATLDYLREHLELVPYRGIGEFHVFGANVRSEVLVGVMALARARSLAVHAHADLEAIRALLVLAPDIPVIWAHGGFDVPVVILRDLLTEHPQLYLELSFREGITTAGRLTPAWRDLFMDFSQRFLIGMDTYIPGRWADLPELAAAARVWLNRLPEGIAAAIVHGNAARLFPEDWPVETGTE